MLFIFFVFFFAVIIAWHSWSVNFSVKVLETENKKTMRKREVSKCFKFYCSGVIRKKYHDCDEGNNNNNNNNNNNDDGDDNDNNYNDKNKCCDNNNNDHNLLMIIIIMTVTFEKK